MKLLFALGEAAGLGMDFISPVLAALVVGTDNYGQVINLGAVALAASLLLALLPSRLLDRSR